MREDSMPSGSGPRVALICLHADPVLPAGVAEGGGTHSYLRELLGFLEETGSHHILFTRWADAAAPAVERTSRLGQVRRLRIGDPGPLDKRELPRLHSVTLGALGEALDQWGRPDLLHSVYWNSGEAAMDHARANRLPFVHTVISNGWRRAQMGFLDQPAERVPTERRVFGAASRIFCISPQERDDLVAAYGVSPERVAVVGRPVAAPYLDPARDGNGAPRPKRLAAATRA
jgi:D-inositol-3-phosphate glycosyltransferase